MEERVPDHLSGKGVFAFETNLYQQQNSLKIPQMKLAQHNSSNPTLLVSDISDISPQRQESMIIGQNNESLDRYKTSSSLLLPQANHSRPWRSNSLTPPTPRNSEDGMTPSQCNMVSNYGVWSGSGNPNYKLRSHSLTVLKNGQLRDEACNDASAGPICTSCGQFNMNGTSLTQLAQIIAGNENQAKISSDEDVDEIIRNLPHGSGMKGLKVYLKKLRLHKYCATFIKYSYEEFLQLNDDTLKRDGVTLGARGKILKSIEKIRNRPEKLKELLITIEEIEAQPDKKHNLQTILNELDEIILMPLKPCELPNENNFYRSCAIFGPPSNGDNTNIHVNVPHMIYKLLEKVFVFTMLGHASDEANQPLYGLLHSALKHECFSECQKSNMKSWIDKLGKVYENVTQPKPFDKRRSLRGDIGIAGRRISIRSGSITSNHHGHHHSQPESSTCQKRHSYAFQEEKMQVTPVALALPSKLNQEYLNCPINRARSSSGLYQATNNNGCFNISDGACRRESSLSNDSGYSILDSRRTSAEVDYFSNIGNFGCNSSLVVPSSPTDVTQQHPLITMQHYNNRRVKDQNPVPLDSSSMSDFLSMQEPITRRDSGLSTNSESSRRSSFFSASPVPPTPNIYGTNIQKLSMPVTSIGHTRGSQHNLGVCSTSSGCSEGSNDSLLEQDLQNLALSVSQKGLE